MALSTRAFCFGSLAQRNEVSRTSINRFLDTMPDGDGQLKIFDINLRQGFYTKEIIRESCQRCNVLKINDEELVAISRMFGYPGIDLQDKCWILLAKYNLKMLTKFSSMTLGLRMVVKILYEKATAQGLSLIHI